MTLQIIILTLGVFASVSLIASALSTTKTRLLIFALISAIILVVQFALTGDALLGMVAVLIGVTRISLVLLSTKIPWLNHWIFIPIFIGLHITAFTYLNDWSHIEIYNFIPVIGGIASTLSYYFKNLIYTKSFLILAGLLWINYEFAVGSYGQLIGETFVIFANSYTLYLLIKAQRTGVPVEEPITEIIHTITTNIPVIQNKVITTLTGSITVINTDTKPIKTS